MFSKNILPLIALLVVSAATVGTAHAQEVNLLKNGGFETEGDWRADWAWAGADSTMRIVRNPADAYEGQGALKVIARKDKLTQFAASAIKLKQGAAYRVSFAYRGEGIPEIKSYLRLQPQPWTTLFSTTVQPVLEWNRAEFVGISPADLEQVCLMFSFESTGTLWIDDVKVTEIELPVGKPENFENQLPNSSFEVLPHYDDWMVGPELTAAQCRLDDVAVSGNTSLRFERALREYPVEFRSAAVNIRPNTPQVLSAYFKSAKPRKVTLGLRSGRTELLTRTFDVGPNWQRCEVTGSSKLGGSAYVTVISNGGPLWMDDAYLCEGEASPEYRPRQAVEAAVQVASLSKTFVEGESVPLAVSIVRHGGAQFVPYHWRLLDWQGREVPGMQGDAPLKPLPAKLVPPKYGLFRVEVQPQNGDPANAVFAYLHKPIAVKPVDSYFGGHYHLREPEISTMKKLGVHWERAHWPPLWTQWRQVEPRKGEWKFADVAMDIARRNEVQIMGSIATTPAWAAPAGKGSEKNAYAMTYPADLEAWKTYVRQVVTHYPQITAWEIFNEPHVSIFWSGDHEQLLKLFETATEVIHEVNPQAKIIGWRVPSLEAVQEHGLLNHLTALSEHNYAHGRTVDQRVEELEKEYGAVKDQLAKIGHPEVGLWNTEFGPGDWGSLRHPADGKGHSRAAEYMLKHISYQLNLGFTKFFPYILVPNFDTDIAAFDADTAPRVGLVVYGTVARFTDGARPAGSVPFKDGRLRGYKTVRDGSETAIIWSRDAGFEAEVKSLPIGVTAYDEMGNALAGPFKVGSMPRILTGQQGTLDFLQSLTVAPK